MHCENYRGIKLLEIGLKVYEKVIERRIRERVELHDSQFCLRPGRGTMDLGHFPRTFPQDFSPRRKMQVTLLK